MVNTQMTVQKNSKADIEERKERKTKRKQNYTNQKGPAESKEDFWTPNIKETAADGRDRKT